MRMHTLAAIAVVMLSTLLMTEASASPRRQRAGRTPLTDDDGIHVGAGIGTGVGRGPAGSDGQGRGVGQGLPVIGGVPIVVIDGVLQPDRGSAPAPGRFGIASECEPSCTVKQSPTGEYYYKYDAYPRVVQVRPHSVADSAGLRAGDLIVEVEGHSILEDGALLNLEQRDRLKMTVRRDGQIISVTLR
jgi:S1-C subfamily serine protease